MVRRLAAPLAWTGYIGVRVPGWGLFDGLPLGPLEATAIALAWWAWGCRRGLPGAAVVTALFLVKLSLGGTLLVDRGFAARYYANGSWTSPSEPSFTQRGASYTRIDPIIAFGPDRDLPLFFLNDLRFNFYRPGEPDRNRLPWSVAWDGLFRASETRSTAFYVSAGYGVTGELAIGGRTVISIEAGAERTADVRLAQGAHTITLRAAGAYGADRHIEAGEIVAGRRVPFSTAHIAAEPTSPFSMRVDRVVRALARAIDIALLAWLGLLVLIRAAESWRGYAVGPLLWLGAVLEAVLFALPYAARLVLLGGGDDPLTYEHLARAIGLGDPLLRQDGPAAGQGAPYYYQPLYPYFLALLHVLFGDDFFGVVFVQRLLVAVTVGAVASISERLFGCRAGRLALLGGGLLIYAKAGRWSGVPLAEPLFMPLLAVWTFMLVRTAAAARSAVTAGLVGGLATLTRSTLVLGWVLALPAWIGARRRDRLRGALILLGVMALMVSLATVRNWMVASRFVPITTSMGVNLHAGNTPPGALVEAPADRVRGYERLGLDRPTQMVVEYVRQQPAAFVRGLGRKALYAIVCFEASGLPGETGTSLVYVLIWAAAAIGWIRMARGGAGMGLVAAIPALLALSHFAIVVIFFPHAHHDRLILPLYPLLIPYGALALEPLASLAIANARLGASASMLAIALVAFVPATGGWADLANALVAVGVIGAIGLYDRPRLTVGAWLCLAYVGALTASFLSDASFGASSEYRRGLMLPVVIFVAARLGRAIEGGRSALRAAFAGTLVLMGGALTAVALFATGGGHDAALPLFGRIADQAGTAGAAFLAALCLRAVIRSARSSGSSVVLALGHGALVSVLAVSLAVDAFATSGGQRHLFVALGVLVGLAERGTGALPTCYRS